MVQRFQGSTIATEEWPARGGGGDHNTERHTIHQGRSDSTQADVQTNTVEGVCSPLKRSVVGSYHQLSVKHMNA